MICKLFNRSIGSRINFQTLAIERQKRIVAKAIELLESYFKNLSFRYKPYDNDDCYDFNFAKKVILNSPEDLRKVLVIDSKSQNTLIDIYRQAVTIKNSGEYLIYVNESSYLKLFSYTLEEIKTLIYISNNIL